MLRRRDMTLLMIVCDIVFFLPRTLNGCGEHPEEALPWVVAVMELT